LVCLDEAWEDAELALVDPERVGLIVGGSNVQQRELIHTIEKYQDRCQFVPPSYAMTFMDSDICGVCTEVFGIQGLAHTVGGASASGQLAIIQAIQAILCNQVDVCIALGCMQDISYFECQAFRAMGAMGSDKYPAAPELCCRPFDRDHDGFIFGESSGAVVLERVGFRRRPAPRNYGTVNGWGIAIDANRNPNSSIEGEVRAIKRAMSCSNLKPRDIHYVNPHGTGSPVGDEIELRALREVGLNNAYINTTKSVIGHGLSSAGTAEVIATLLQMQQNQIHPCLNLQNPLCGDFNWVCSKIDAAINQALCLSYGFGGINTALCFQKS
jgi:malonyl-ACP decarboxylase